jgi:hypothetical protein
MTVPSVANALNAGASGIRDEIPFSRCSGLLIDGSCSKAAAEVRGAVKKTRRLPASVAGTVIQLCPRRSRPGTPHQDRNVIHGRASSHVGSPSD